MTPVSRVTRLVTVLVTIVTLVTGLQEWREQPRSTTALEGQDTVIACKVHNKVIRSDHDNIMPLARCSGGSMFLAEGSSSDLSLSWKI